MEKGQKEIFASITITSTYGNFVATTGIVCIVPTSAISISATAIGSSMS